MYRSTVQFQRLRSSREVEPTDRVFYIDDKDIRHYYYRVLNKLEGWMELDDGEIMSVPCELVHKDILEARIPRDDLIIKYGSCGIDDTYRVYIRTDNSPVSDAELSKLRMLGLLKG